MKYQRTQVYLDPPDHRALVAEAARRGVSLAALVREIVADFVARGRRHAPERTFDAIVGIADTDAPSDIAKQGDEFRKQALERRYERKGGKPLRFADSTRARSKKEKRS